MCVCVRACVRACVRGCVHACVHACVCECNHVRVHACEYVHACMSVCLTVWNGRSTENIADMDQSTVTPLPSAGL